MTPTEYRAAIARLGFKGPSEAGKWFGRHAVTGRHWALKGPPPEVAKMVRFMLAMEYTPDYVDRMIER